MSKRQAVRLNLYKSALLAGAAWASMTAFTLAAPAAFAAESAADSNTVQELVVTATRREVTVRDAPVAVSAFGGAALQAHQIGDVGDLSSLVPNLQFGSSYGTGHVTIRGIGTNDLTGGADPGVAYHLDGVYVGATGPAGNSFFDVSRIEVLRGPQGTLFGQNATGGSVNLIPNRPTPQAGGYASVTVGADPTLYSLEGVLNGPLDANGTLAGRLSVLKTYNEGFARNLSTTGPRHLDNDDSVGVRGQLLYKPNDAFELHGAINYQKADGNGPGYQLLGRGGTSGLPTTAELLGGKPAPLDSHDVYANQGIARGEFQLATVDGTVKVGPGKLKFIVSTGRVTSFVQTDGDNTAVDLVHYDIRYTSHQTFGEVTYEFSPIKGLDLIVGANGFRQDKRQNFDVPISFLFGPTTVTIALGGHLSNRSFAEFAHADYSLTDRIKVFGGVRHTSDEKVYNTFNNFVGTNAGAPSCDQTTYEGGVSAKLTDQVNGYVKYSTGFKGGGVQLGDLSPPARPETNESTEAGLKGLFFSRSLEANLAVFHMPYKDLQLTKVRGLVPGYQNAAQATIDGAELEVNWHATKDFRVEFSGSLLDARFDSFTSANPADPVPVDLNLAGNRLPNTARSAFSLGGYYTFAGVAGGSLTAGGRYYWQGKEYLDSFNVPVMSQAAVGRVDLSLNYTSGDGVWTGSVFAKNLTDEIVRTTGVVASTILGAPAYGTLAPGRTVGVTLRRNF